MPSSPHQLANILRAEIDARGSISLARFMELALCHPVHGYYRQPLEQIGCQDHLYPSVSVGPLFGHLLAFQFSQWLESLLSANSEAAMGSTPTVQLVEAGAHDGRLAADL